jgi:hypothetical protein
MGAWGTAIKSNDTSADIYEEFFEQYNEGKEPNDIGAKLIADNEELIGIPEDCNNFWFALALALWETKSLNAKVHDKVRSIIQSGNDLEMWRELDADEDDIKKRKVVLDKFLAKLETEKPKAKARKKKIIKDPIFEKGTCLTFKLENGNYGGAVVLAADRQSGFGYNLIVSTRINQSAKPTENDFVNADILIKNFSNWKEDHDTSITWYLPDRYKKDYSSLFEIVHFIGVDIDYEINKTEFNASYSGNWRHIDEPVTSQFEHETTQRKPKSVPLRKLTKKKKWWLF